MNDIPICKRKLCYMELKPTRGGRRCHSTHDTVVGSLARIAPLRMDNYM